MPYLDLLLNQSLQLLHLLGEGLFASGQLRHQGFLLLQLATKLTCRERGTSCYGDSVSCYGNSVSCYGDSNSKIDILF